MESNPFVDPRIAQLYELENGWAADQDFYMELAADNIPLDICDLGCGTGLLTLALARKGIVSLGLIQRPLCLMWRDRNWMQSV